MERLKKYILGIQASYIFITALWPLIDIESFIRITGPKVDIWLVKTVGALLLSVSTAMLYSLTRRHLSSIVVVLAMTNAFAFICIDFWYSYIGRISTVYMLDGLLQLSFIFAWCLALVGVGRRI
jgi:hypothetical protein